MARPKPIDRVFFALRGYVDQKNLQRITNPDTVEEFLREVLKYGELAPKMVPYVWKSYPKHFSSQWGVSGFVITTESGQVAVHTFPIEKRIELIIIFREKPGVDTIGPMVRFAIEHFCLTAHAPYLEPTTVLHDSSADS
jgi:hypothetical protein